MTRTVIVETRKRGGRVRTQDNEYYTKQYEMLVIDPSRSNARAVSALFFGMSWAFSTAIMQYLGYGWMGWLSYNQPVIFWDMLYASVIPSLGFALFVYFVVFNHQKVYYREDYKNFLEQLSITEETVSETTEEDTAVLDYSTGTNADDALLINRSNGSRVTNKRESPITIDGMTFSSEQMAFLRRLAIYDNHISRDEEWKAMNEAGMIEGDYKTHFRLAKKLFTRREWVADNRWTPAAYKEFLKVSPPHSTDDLSNILEITRDDGDDDEQTP